MIPKWMNFSLQVNFKTVLINEMPLNTLKGVIINIIEFCRSGLRFILYTDYWFPRKFIVSGNMILLQYFTDFNNRDKISFIIAGSWLPITKDIVLLLVLFLPVNETNKTCVSGSELQLWWCLYKLTRALTIEKTYFEDPSMNLPFLGN